MERGNCHEFVRHNICYYYDWYRYVVREWRRENLCRDEDVLFFFWKIQWIVFSPTVHFTSIFCVLTALLLLACS